MTYKEWMIENKPEFTGSMFIGGVYVCPYDYGLETKEKSLKNCESNGGYGCIYCWNRHKPITLKDLIEKKNKE